MAAAGALESGDLELEPRLQLLRSHVRVSLLARHLKGWQNLLSQYACMGVSQYTCMGVSQYTCMGVSQYTCMGV